MSLDPAGLVLGVLLDGDPVKGPGPTTLLDTATGQLKGRITGGASCLGDRATYYAAGGSTSIGFQVSRTADDKPLVILGLNAPPASVINQFHPTQPHLAWGNADGTVTVADLDVIQRRLTEVNLGW